jgi:RNA polymerase sigma-70 factor (ECF subfamily)
MMNFESTAAAGSNILQASWSQLTDRDLVGLVVSGNDEAFAVICNRSEQMLFRTACRIVGCESDAEDVVQEALLSAYRNIATFRFASSLSTWLNQIAINCSLMELRRRRHRKCLSLNEATEDGLSFMEMIRDSTVDVEDALLLKEQLQLLTACIAQLPPKLRSVVEAYRTLDPTIADLAQSHAITKAAVKSRLARAKTMIKNSKPILNATRRTQRGRLAGRVG